jgi:hypothetical protein
VIAGFYGFIRFGVSIFGFGNIYQELFDKIFKVLKIKNLSIDVVG